MAKLEYPSFVIEQERQKQIKAAADKKAAEKAAARAAKAAARRECAEKRQYIREHSRGIPLFLKECVREKKEALGWYFLLWLLIVCGAHALVNGGENLDLDSWSPKSNLLVISGVGLAMVMILWIMKVMAARRSTIYEKAKLVDEYKLNETHKKEMMGDAKNRTFNTLWRVRCLCGYEYEMPNNTPSIERRLWAREFANNPVYFDILHRVLMGNLELQINVEPEVAQMIIENHLKTHPADIERVKDLYDINTIPKKLLTQCEKQR